MASTNETAPRDDFARHVPAVGAAFVLAVAVPLGLLRGAPSVVLWVAFALLAAAVLIFWEALRTALDPAAPGDEADTDGQGVPSDLEARKRAALKALKDIDFERSIGRLSDDDHKELEGKYRAEARAAMRAIDEGLGPWLTRAEGLLDAATSPRDASPAKGAETAASDAGAPRDEAKAPATVTCPKCDTPNDGDAVFCKKCGTRLAPEAAHAP